MRIRVLLMAERELDGQGTDFTWIPELTRIRAVNEKVLPLARSERRPARSLEFFVTGIE
jgi:hypothetical protein